MVDISIVIWLKTLDVRKGSKTYCVLSFQQPLHHGAYLLWGLFTQTIKQHQAAVTLVNRVLGTTTCWDFAICCFNFGTRKMGRTSSARIKLTVILQQWSHCEVYRGIGFGVVRVPIHMLPTLEFVFCMAILLYCRHSETLRSWRGGQGHNHSTCLSTSHLERSCTSRETKTTWWCCYNQRYTHITFESAVGCPCSWLCFWRCQRVFSDSFLLRQRGPGFKGRRFLDSTI